MTREEAVRRALELAPGSLRAVALEAGLSPRLLTLIIRGERRATEATVERLVAALERLGARHLEAAHLLHAAQSEEAHDAEDLTGKDFLARHRPGDRQGRR